MKRFLERVFSRILEVYMVIDKDSKREGCLGRIGLNKCYIVLAHVQLA